MHAWVFQKASLCMVGANSSHTREAYLIILCHRIHVAARILDYEISFMVGVFSALSSSRAVICLLLFLFFFEFLALQQTQELN